MKKHLLAISIFISLASGAQIVPRGLTASSNGVYIGFYEYKPVDYNPAIKYPLIIFLHGIGERGNGTTELYKAANIAIPAYIAYGAQTMRFTWNGITETFLVLAPQLSNSYGSWQNFYVDEMINYAKANMSIDTNRIMLTGLSLGGGGTWNYAGSTNNNARKFAAIAPVCGTCQGVNFCNIANASLPVWAFHAQNDGVVAASCTHNSIQNILNCNPAVKPYKTIWPDGDHYIWDRAYDYNYSWQNPNIYEWMLGQNKSLPVNVRPNANAGPDITISTSTPNINLSGALSTDADGTLVRFVWRKLSGPAAGMIAFPVSATGLTNVVGLTIPGTYQYELKAIDNRADWKFDTINVTVTNGVVSNIPPVAEAGLNVVTVTTSANLNGSNTYDPDGVVISYKWRKILGPGQYTISDDLNASPSVLNLVPGVYEFELEATDNLGAKNKDTVTVIDASVQIPVQMLYFKGKIDGTRTRLEWATASEYNNDHFAIERSEDGLRYQPIGKVSGMQVSFKRKEYEFIDEATTALRHYYRLRQVDKDGKYEYSSVVIINRIEKLHVETFPNPVKNSLSLVINDKAQGKMSIRLYSTEGKLAAEWEAVKTHDVSTAVLDVHHLPAGIYMLEVAIAGDTRYAKKVIKQ